ncbi:hypothetical protein BASA60_006547 [Batrachochytrium salamandrivorans]|nr:hypothetical protein BASA60_006547 [Batrachochytrium salamandrivorans]
MALQQLLAYVSVSSAQLVFMDNQQIFNGPLDMLNPMSFSGSVFERDLVSEAPVASSIILQQSTFSVRLSDHRLLADRAVLGYITPWNNHGYDIAEMFRGKFTHISPLWYHIKRLDNKIILEGSHNVNTSWIDQVRLPNSHGKQLILVIPPRHSHMESDPFDANDLLSLAPHVDYFSLMTYDHSQSKGYGPNAPLDWIKDNVNRICPKMENRPKILMGLNMYGYDFNHQTSQTEAIVGPQYIDLLKKYAPVIQWDLVSREHHLTYNDAAGHKHTVYYPTLKSIHERLSLASDSLTGVSLWELGQGLDYFRRRLILLVTFSISYLQFELI